MSSNFLLIFLLFLLLNLYSGLVSAWFLPGWVKAGSVCWHNSTSWSIPLWSQSWWFFCICRFGLQLLSSVPPILVLVPVQVVVLPLHQTPDQVSLASKTEIFVSVPLQSAGLIVLVPVLVRVLAPIDIPGPAVPCSGWPKAMIWSLFCLCSWS